jgi:maltooligosyltrehalose trehalohydrolase
MSTEAPPRRRTSAKKPARIAPGKAKTTAAKKVLTPARQVSRRKAAPDIARRLPVGAEVVPGGVHFRVWAPARKSVEVVFEGPTRSRPGSLELTPEGNGYFSGLVEGAGAGALYRFRLDGGDGEEQLYPDPASRFQPQGPHGPSQVVDPATYRWRDKNWRGVGREGQVLYEIHIGTFTPEGTWAAAERELPELADLGVTVLEVMPVADFPGRFGWGYDGVNLFAPTRLYGQPDDFRRFVDRAHALGIGVVLDVVYNHLGPDGNYLKPFTPLYFTDRYRNDWGESLNFDGTGKEDAGPVREYFLANAGYWIDEFHLDGLRLDATQDIHDDGSEEHILAAIARRVRETAAGGHRRATYLVAENESQDTRLALPPEQGGTGLDALWNDDFHHSAHVALTGRKEAYYSDYQGSPQEMISTAKYGYLYQGQRYAWQEKRRGRPSFGLPASAFVHYLQNHDQVANSARGERCHLLAGPGRFRALTALLLLGPQTPLLFQGQEFCASSPFVYFADHGGDLGAAVKRGRGEFLSQFPSLAAPEIQQGVPDPADPATFEMCKLDLAEREKHAPCYALCRDLLRLRREDPAFRGVPGPAAVDGAVLGSEAFVLRFFHEEGDRLLVVNLGRDLDLTPAPEPLLAPPPGAAWEVVWSSEDPRYGGIGSPAPENDAGGWCLPGQAAVVLRPRRETVQKKKNSPRKTREKGKKEPSHA